MANRTYRTNRRTPAKGHGAPARKRSPKRGTPWWKVLLAVLLVLAVIGGGVGIAYYATDGFGTKEPPADIVAELGGKEYEGSADGIVIFSGTELKFTSNAAPGEAFDLSVRITAREQDFSFLIGEEPWKWSHLEGRDVTKGFTFTRTEQGVIMSYGTPAEVLSAALGMQVTVGRDISFANDLFILSLTGRESGSRIEFGFRLGVTALQAELSPGHIEF